jgi:hypothetical protein
LKASFSCCHVVVHGRLCTTTWPRTMQTRASRQQQQQHIRHLRRRRTQLWMNDVCVSQGSAYAAAAGVKVWCTHADNCCEPAARSCHTALLLLL